MNNEYDDDMITCEHCGERRHPEVGMSFCDCFFTRTTQANQQPCSEEDLRKEIAYMNNEVTAFYKEASEIWGVHPRPHWKIRPNPTSTRSKNFQGAYVHQRQFVKEKSPSNVTPIPVEPKFPKEDELFQRLNAVVSDYSGELSLVATVGVLELLKLAIIERTK